MISYCLYLALKRKHSVFVNAEENLLRFSRRAGLSIYSPTASDKTLPESEFPENIYHGLHWCVVSDSERAQVENTPQLQRMGTVGWQFWGVFGEVHNGVAYHPILTLSCILCTTERSK